MSDTRATENALTGVQMAGVILASVEDDLKALVDADRYMDNVGGLLDPTLYKRTMYSTNYRNNVNAAKEAMRFIAALRDIGVNLEKPEATPDV